MSRNEMFVVGASSLGTVFEWYDFFVYAAVAKEISEVFFKGLTPSVAYIFTLLVFAAGFAVRPFGAILFGRIGDLVGRKYTFLVTITMMGVATVAIGLLPGAGTIGIASAILLVALRMLQGLALGGEYGGAVIYVAEHAPNDRRGAWTAWIQITAAAGLVLSLAVILPTRYLLGAAQFADWGWRVPFIVSVFLLLISLWIRLQLDESPEFLRMKEEGRVSTAPLAEAFGRWRNLRLVLVALFSSVMGQAVVWYTGLFYSSFFLTQTLQVDGTVAQLLIAASVIITMPFYVVAGALSDRIGRRPVFLAGVLCGALFFFPLFKALTHYANPAAEAVQAKPPVQVIADPADCSIQFSATGGESFSSSCDVVSAKVAKTGLPNVKVAAPAGAIATVKVGGTTIEGYNGKAPDAKEKAKSFDAALKGALKKEGYTIGAADLSQINIPMTLLVLVAMMMLGTLTYGPLAAMLVEMFPSQIRYTAMSLPYHIGIGWFGGFLPAAAFAIVAATGDPYAGLWYPTILSAVAFVITLVFVRESHTVDIYDPALRRRDERVSRLNPGEIGSRA